MLTHYICFVTSDSRIVHNAPWILKLKQNVDVYSNVHYLFS